MPQSLSSLLVHLVFSTKDREPWLLDSFRDELHAYLGGTISNHHGVLLKAGSVTTSTSWRLIREPWRRRSS